MTKFLIDFDVLGGNRHGETNKKWTDQRILDRYVVTYLKVTSQERAEFTFNRFNRE
jgi:hypothetical protein